MSAINPEMAAISRKAGVLASLAIAASSMMSGSHPAEVDERKAIALDLMDAAAYLSAQVSIQFDKIVYD